MVGNSIIPEKLKRDEFRFIKIKAKDKIPLEFNWTDKNNYPYDSAELEHHINSGGNYGVVCGYGDLIVIDCDDAIAEKLVEDNLPETFSVKTGSGMKHFYYFCKTGRSLKVFKNKSKDTLADIQFIGKQVIGPGSIHPNGNQYVVVDELPIERIHIQKILDLFGHYLKYSHNLKQRNKQRTSVEETDRICKEIKSKIKIPDILTEIGIDINKNPTDCLWHDSKAGKCFSYTDETFHCFHCEKSGSIFDLYMTIKSLTFTKARNDLAQKFGIKSDEDEAQEQGFLFGEFTSNINILEVSKEFIKKQPIYYDESKTWWVWNFIDTRWVLADETAILNSIDNLTKTPTVNSKIKNEWLEALKRIGRLNKPKPIPKTWIQFKDIIVDVKTNERYDATPEYFVTNPLPREIGNIDYTPHFDILFKQWVGEKYVKTLYEIIAYCMLPDYPIHRIFCFVGSGLNGKSKFLTVLNNFIGQYNTTTTELDNMLMSRFELSRLHKRLVCQIGETNFNQLDKTAKLKSLSGGDLIAMERKNRDPFEDYNYAKILITTNNLPTTTDKTIGFYRRWMIIDFPNKFNEKIDVLEDIPEDEYDALACKLIPILKDLLEVREFTNEGTIEDREKRYEERSNPFQKFWDDNIEVEQANDFIPKYDFRKKLEEWCQENNFRKISDRSIAKFMKEKEIEDGRETMEWHTKEGEKPRVNVWFGIKWKE